MLGFMLKAAANACERRSSTTGYRLAGGVDHRVAYQSPGTAQEPRRWPTASPFDWGSGPRRQPSTARPCPLRIVWQPVSNVPGGQSAYARTHTNIGVLLAQLRKRPEAEAEYREALGLQRQLAADFANVPEYRRSIARSLFNLGSLLSGMGRPADAKAEFRKALQLQRQLVEQFPNVIDYRSNLGRTLHNLAMISYKEGDSDEARRLFEKAIEQQLKARRAVPGNPTYGELLCDHFKGLADSNIRLKGMPKAADAAARLAQGRPDAADGLYGPPACSVAAWHWSRQNPALSAARRSASARGDADQGRGQSARGRPPPLRRTVGPLKTSGVFAPLRGRPDFQQLIHELSRR